MTETSERHPFTGQPIGPPVDATPARRPGSAVLEGRYGRVEKLRPDHDADLWSVVKGHDPIWTYMSAYGPFANFAAFSEWLATRTRLDDPYSYAVVEPAGRAVPRFSRLAMPAMPIWTSLTSRGPRSTARHVRLRRGPLAKARRL